MRTKKKSLKNDLKNDLIDIVEDMKRFGNIRSTRDYTLKRILERLSEEAGREIFLAKD